MLAWQLEVKTGVADSRTCPTANVSDHLNKRVSDGHDWRNVPGLNQVVHASVMYTPLLDSEFGRVFSPDELRVFALRCSEHTCLVQLGRNSGLIRWRVARAAVSNAHQNLLAVCGRQLK